MLRTTLPILAALSIAASCGPRDAKRGDSASARTAHSPIAKRLLAALPATTASVAFLDADRSLWSMSRDYMFVEITPDEQRALDDELFGYLQQTTGVDPRNLQSVIAFAHIGERGPGGGLMLSPVTGTLRGGPTVSHGSHALTVLGTVAAILHGDTLIVGDSETVGAVLDVLDGKSKGLVASGAPLSKVLTGELAGANMGVVADKQTLSFLPMLEPYGLDRVTMMAKGSGISLVAQGTNIGPLKQEFDRGAAAMMADMAREKDRAKARFDVAEAIPLIWMHHTLTALVKRATPRVEGNRLTVQLDTTMSGESTGLLAATMGVMAAVAVPAFARYTSKSKTTEARQFVKKIYDGARAYYMDPPVDGSIQVPPPSFPRTTALTPPAGSCCQGGTDKCLPNAELWVDDSWIALQFSVDDPHYYSYQFIRSADGKGFTARAIGDLDCDGVYSTFEMYGTINEQYPDGPSGNADLYRENELE